MKKRHPEHNFWVSYSDLATGLMIVFMVVMLMMVTINKFEAEKKQREAEATAKALIKQRNELRRVVQAIQLILGAKQGLSAAINRAFKDDPDVSSDPVTAQLVLSESKLRFEKKSAEISEEGKAFLNSFTPRYVCALYLQDLARCRNDKTCLSREAAGEGGARERSRAPDPGAVNGVRRIFVAGHADMVGSLGRNHELSAQRAEAVVRRMLEVLDCAVHNALRTERRQRPRRCAVARWGDGRRNRYKDPYLPAARLPSSCTDTVDTRAVFEYARHRLLAIGAGDTDHSRSEFQREARRHGWARRFDSLLGRREGHTFTAAHFRKVTLGLELTGDDMTALLLNVRLLQRELHAGTPLGSGGLAPMVKAVAEACWEDPKRYHGCDAFIRKCHRKLQPEAETFDPEGLDEVCGGFDAALVDAKGVQETPLAARVRELLPGAVTEHAP